MPIVSAAAGRALHEPPHVHHRDGAGAQALGVGQAAGRLGDLGGQRLVGRVDVGLEPVPQRHRLGRAAQQARVQVAVVQAGDARRGRWRRPPRRPPRAGRRRAPRPARRRRSSCPRSAPNPGRARPWRPHRQDDAVADERGHGAEPACAFNKLSTFRAAVHTRFTVRRRRCVIVRRVARRHQLLVALEPVAEALGAELVGAVSGSAATTSRSSGTAGSSGACACPTVATRCRA